MRTATASHARCSKTYKVGNRATGQEHHDDPQLLALEVRAVVASDMRALALRQHADLLLNVLDLVLGVLEIDDLDGDLLLGLLVDAVSVNERQR